MSSNAHMIDGSISFVIFVLEVIILGFVITKSRDNPQIRFIASLLLLLLTYQLSEFILCTNWSDYILRLSHVIITFLPPVGYHFATRLAKYKRRDWIIPYIIGIAFAIYYVFAPDAVTILDCNPYYADYYSPMVMLFTLFYSGTMLYTIGFLALKSRNHENAKQMKLLILGYLSFIVPMLATMVYDIAFQTVTTSVMCKYAFLLAVILGVMSLKK